MKERDETRERFLAAIADKLPAERIIEAHLFQPIRQSGFESGVGVVAVDEQPNIRGEAAAENPIRAEGAAENTVVGAAENAAIGAAENRPDARSASAENHRLAVYTAKYRLTLKGAERGKWEFAVQVDADASLVTIDKVVRGVQRRSGDTDDPERLSGDEFRALLPPREPAQGQSI